MPLGVENAFRAAQELRYRFTDAATVWLHVWRSVCQAIVITPSDYLNTSSGLEQPQGKSARDFKIICSSRETTTRKPAHRFRQLSNLLKRLPSACSPPC